MLQGEELKGVSRVWTIACDVRAGVKKRREIVDMVVSKNSRDHWKIMIMVTVSNVLKGWEWVSSMLATCFLFYSSDNG